METLNVLAKSILDNLEKNRLPDFDVLNSFINTVKGLTESEIQDSPEAVELYSLCLERHEHPLSEGDNIDFTALEEALPYTINKISELIKRVVEKAISIRDISDEQIESRMAEIKKVLDRANLLSDLIESMTKLWMPLESCNEKHIVKEKKDLLNKIINKYDDIILENIKF